MQKVVVRGYSYGYDEKGNFVPFESLFREIRKVRALHVRSQYGWRDGCQDRDHRYILKPKIIEFRRGNEHTLSYALIEGILISEEEFEKLSESS